MSYTVERPDRPAAEVAAAHDDAPSRTLLGSASTFTARLLESAKARAELLQSQAQVTMAAASERIRGKSDPTLAPEADQAEISAGGQEAGAAQSAPHKSASALASTVMAAAADLSRKTREGSSAAYQAALEGIRRLTAPSRRIAVSARAESVCREEVRSKPCPHTLLLCCNALCLTGLHTRGIFKDAPLPGAQPAADQLAAQLEAGAVLLPVNLDPVTAAACIKLFLVSLDDPLMTHSAFDTAGVSTMSATATTTPDADADADADVGCLLCCRLLDRWVNAGHSLAAGTLTPQEVEQLLAALPLANRVSAALIIQTCYRIASQFDKTGMNALALAQELGPLLLWRVSSGQEALHVAAAAAANTPAWAGASLVAGIQALRAKVGAHPAATTPSGPADPSGTSPTISHPPHQAQAQTPPPSMGLPVSTALGGGGGGDGKWAGGAVQAGLDDVGGEELEELDVGQGPTEGQLAPGPAPGGPSADAAAAAARTGASGSGQQDKGQGQGQAVKVVIAERRQVIKAALRSLVEAAQPDLSPTEVDAVVAEVNKRMTMGSKQCVLAAVLCLSVLLQSFLAPAQLPPPVPLNILDPKLLAQIKDAMELLTKASVLEHLMRGPHHSGIKLLPGEVAVFEQPSSAWLIAMLQQLDEEHLRGDLNSLNANATTIITSIQEFYRHPGRFIGLWCKAFGVVEGGFSRTMKKHFPQLVLGRLDYSQPDPRHRWRLPANSMLRQPRWKEEVAKHRRLLGLPATWREGQDSIGKGGAGRLPLEKRVRYALFVNRSLEGWQTPHDTCPRPFTMLPMVRVRARHFVIDDRVLHGLLTDLGMTDLTQLQFLADSLPHWQKFIQYSQLQNNGWEFARRVETDGVSISVHFVRSQAVTEPVELPFIGRKLTATSDYDPATHIAVGVDPGVTQAIKAGHAQRDPVTGQVLRQWEWELSKGQLKHDSGLTKAKQDTARWSTAIQPQLLQLAAATPAGTTLGGLHAHVLALNATWDALWEAYLKPRWRRQRLALHHAQERIIEGFCKKVVNGMKWVSRHYYHTERGVAVFLGAGNFSQGGWKAGAVRAGFRKVVEQPSRPSADPRPDRLVIVDEFRTSRVSSSVHARQPCELHLPPNQPRPAYWVPPAGQVNPRLVRPAWSLRHAKYVRGLSTPPPPPAQAPPPPPPAQAQPLPAAPGPAPPPQAPPGGRWLDRDTNGCLNLQRIGESRQRPIELCRWDDLEALPPIGKEYQQGYKRVNDRLPKGRQWLHRAAEYRRGIDGRARNNA
ncbi:hypothetical protein QJQ45_030548 [Haematococcus lacustris]|nr:hypothetical protein QJQ45_030548 [Haematococcus lacustris]